MLLLCSKMRFVKKLNVGCYCSFFVNCKNFCADDSGNFSRSDHLGYSTFSEFECDFLFFNVKRSSHFVNITVLARRIGCEGVHVPTPFLFRILSITAAMYVGDICVAVRMSVILSSNLYLQILKHKLSIVCHVACSQ